MYKSFRIYKIGDEVIVMMKNTAAKYEIMLR